MAVISGANSALTAVRDQTSFASHVYLIHRRGELTADPSLVKEVTQSKNLKIYPDTVVRCDRDHHEAAGEGVYGQADRQALKVLYRTFI